MVSVASIEMEQKKFTLKAMMSAIAIKKADLEDRLKRHIGTSCFLVNRKWFLSQTGLCFVFQVEKKGEKNPRQWQDGEKENLQF